MKNYIKTNLSEFPNGFGHDAEITSIKNRNGTCEIELVGSVIQTITIPNVIALLLTEVTVQNVVFEIKELISVMEIKKIFNDLQADALYSVADQDSFLQKIEQKKAILLHIDSTIGAKGFIITSASKGGVQLTKR